MKKIILSLSIFLVFCFIFVGCSEKNDEESKTTTSNTTNIVESITITTETTTEVKKTTETTTEKQTEKQTFSSNEDTTTTTKKNQSNPLISDEDMEKIENSNAEVFFTDNPNNKYIVAVSDKYGSNKENLVALVKVNAEFPSATVLEFSGKKDANGDLVMTYTELKYVYDVNEETNTVVKASKNGLDNDGVSFVEAKILITLTKEYFIPELPNLKANKRLPE